MANDDLKWGTEFKPDFRYEEIQYFFRKHWTHFLKILVLGLLLGLLVFLIVLGLYGLVEGFSIQILRPFFVFVTILLIFVYFNLFFLEIVSYFFDVVIVTDHRIIISQKTVFLKNNSGAIDLTKIQDLTVESQGIVQNYLHYGSMIITLSASTPPIIIECVPRPHEYLERTNRIKREHILKRQERRIRPGESPETTGRNEPYLRDNRELLKSAP